jgi:hypothetical protein
MIRRVGHVRVFAGARLDDLGGAGALCGFPDWIVWTLAAGADRVLFLGVYVTAESWLNNAATNETRGQTLSLYMIVQMVGHHRGAGPAEPGRSVRLHAVRHPLGAGVAGLHADPAVDQRRRRPSTHQADELSSQLYAGLAAGLRGDVPDGRGLFGAVRHGGGLGHAGGAERAEISTFVAAIFVGGLVLQYPDRLAVGPDGPAPPDHGGGGGGAGHGAGPSLFCPGLTCCWWSGF